MIAIFTQMCLGNGLGNQFSHERCAPKSRCLLVNHKETLEVSELELEISKHFKMGVSKITWQIRNETGGSTLF